MIQYLRDVFSPQQRRVIGAEAKQLLENKHFREAFSAVETRVIESAKSCDPNKPDHAQNIVITLQLLEAVKREIVRKIEDGEMAKIELDEIEKKTRKSVFLR